MTVIERERAITAGYALLLRILESMPIRGYEPRSPHFAGSFTSVEKAHLARFGAPRQEAPEPEERSGASTSFERQRPA